MAGPERSRPPDPSSRLVRVVLDAIHPQGPIADAVEAEASRQKVIGFLDWAVKEYGADPLRVVLAGFSQGAIMSASVALTEPEKVTAAVLMSGRILPEVVPLAASSERRNKTRYLIVHGTRDDVLPIANGRASRDTLRSLGIEPAIPRVPDGAHHQRREPGCCRRMGQKILTRL